MSAPGKLPSPPTNPPDIMNDPQFAQKKGPEEVETCRICRGEGTKDESLYYPCKCSGSIKFVHQDCLMEWLSHSQKKHCELCKTPFRFTKLYHPQMPSSVPTAVFLRLAILHVVNNLLVWCRGILVTFIWVFLLPWSIRWTWRALFWVADGGWTRAAQLEEASGVKQGTSSRLGASPSTTVQTLKETTLVHASLRWMSFQFTAKALASNTTSDSTLKNSTSESASPIFTHYDYDGSLLSGFKFFQTLSPYPTLNRCVTDMLEGQIITLCVVVAFILIFLIREWVIQQQPVIHMAALDDDQRDVPNAEIGAEAPQEDTNQQPEVMSRAASRGDIDELLARLQTEDANRHSQPAADNQVSDPASEQIQDRVWAPRMLEIHKLLSSLEAEAKRGIQNRNSISLSTTKAHLGHFKKIPPALPDRYRRTLEANIKGLETIIDAALTTLNTQESSRSTDDTSNAAESSLEQPGQSSSHLEPALNAARPAMPSRSDSLLATDIQRNLQENASHAEPTDITTRQPDLDGANSSDNGSGSWQYVPESWEDESPSQIRAIQHDEPRATSNNSESVPESSSNTASFTLGFDGAQDAISAEPGPSMSESNLRVSDEIANSIVHVSARAANIQPITSNLSSQDAPNPSSQDISNLSSQDTSTPSQDTATQTASEDIVNEGVEPTIFVETTAVPPEEEAVQMHIFGRLLDWVWGDEVPAEGTEPNQGNDGHIVQDIQQEAPFVPFINAQPENRDGQDAERVVQQADVAEAAADHADHNQDEPGVEADAEDLEGIMELIGMQGPLLGLFQNAIFSAVLILVTLLVCVWLPYLWGKVVLILAANPVQLVLKVPAQIISVVANFAVDFCLFFGAIMIHWLELLLRVSLRPLSWLVKSIPGLPSTTIIGRASGNVADAALLRIVNVFMLASESADSDIFQLSLNAHAALRSIQSELYATVAFIGSFCWDVYNHLTDLNSQNKIKDLTNMCYRALLPISKHIYNTTVNMFSDLMSAFQSTLQSTSASAPESLTVDTALAYWNATDRIIAIVAGYCFFALIGAFYLSRGGPFTSSQRGRKFEAVLTEFLQQAGGVLKVILIISIEMIVFPLYCGFLLDIAMLPLFEHVSFFSRLNFTLTSPWTSIFVHWFIGTCYMFHFALFVSMCRKIMRTGVLYFIRDPDDPTFHPIRDVLERPVTSQLRKIAFSGLVYGGLVIVCLGSVVWALNYAVVGFLPVHWTSGEPILGFPIDLLMYNFLMPLVLRSTRPSRELQRMYEWWFRKCARQLRLTQFLFGDQKDDEEGNPSYESVGQSKSGKYVRAPASDQVRIPKDRDVFLEVDRDNKRIDGAQDQDKGIHGRDDPHFTKVYIPPWFMARIGLFVVCLWALTAVAGVIMTVIPLLLGRNLSAIFMSGDGPVNDIHAFAIGIYIFGAGIHVASKHQKALKSAVWSLIPSFTVPTLEKLKKRRDQVLKSLKRYAVGVLRIAYTYGAFTILFPALFALVLQFYAVMPLHTYIKSLGYGVARTEPPAASLPDEVANNTAATKSHNIHFLQDWTLGLLYLRIALRLIMMQANSRPARALRAIVQNGWLRPNARLATRCFIVPAIIISTIALLLPAALGWLAGRVLTASMNDPATAADVKILAYRYAYPAVLSFGLAIWGCFGLVKATVRWRLRIRDEVYLIGERLHNFGEKKPPPGRPMGSRFGNRQAAAA